MKIVALSSRTGEYGQVNMYRLKSRDTSSITMAVGIYLGLAILGCLRLCFLVYLVLISKVASSPLGMRHFLMYPQGRL